jgi:predicted esterase
MTKICLIFLHGSGSCGSDIKTYLDTVPLPDFEYRTFTQVAQSLSLHVVTITARSRRYSPLGGEECNVWFDRSPFFQREGMNDVEDSKGVEESLAQLMSTAHNVYSGYSHLFVGGFSMGGGLALHALRKGGPPNLRGIFAMGSYAVQRSALVNGPLGTNASLPVLMMHGKATVNVQLTVCFVDIERFMSLNGQATETVSSVVTGAGRLQPTCCCGT